MRRCTCLTIVDTISKGASLEGCDLKVLFCHSDVLVQCVAETLQKPFRSSRDKISCFWPPITPHIVNTSTIWKRVHMRVANRSSIGGDLPYFTWNHRQREDGLHVATKPKDSHLKLTVGREGDGVGGKGKGISFWCHFLHPGKMEQ